MNKTLTTIVCVIVVIGAMILAVVIYTSKEDKESKKLATKIEQENIIDDCTEEYEYIQNKVLQANSEDEKISPNCSIILKKHYKKCGHSTSEYLDIPEELVNKTKVDLQKAYDGWTIEKFSDTKIILSKEEEGECKEHYIIKDNDGKVTIYEILEDGSNKEYEVTDISTEYLPETDKMNIKNGIQVNGKQNLNQLIEDFE